LAAVTLQLSTDIHAHATRAARVYGAMATESETPVHEPVTPGASPFALSRESSPRASCASANSGMTTSTQEGSTSTGPAGLLRAVAEGDLQQVVGVLDTCSPAVVNVRTRGTTALHEAAKAGHLSICQELINRTAEVNTGNRSGCTALHFATLCKDKCKALQVAEALLSSGAVVNSHSDRMDTPLHFASYCPPTPGSEEVIRCLLSRKALTNARNRNSETPLINAAIRNNADAVKVLLELNADVGQRNSLDKTAHDIATDRGCSEVIEVIERMRDPLAQLSDTTQLMRAALSQMQAVDSMSGELKRQSVLLEAYEVVASAAVSDLDQAAQSRMVVQALTTLRCAPEPMKEGSLAPAAVTFSQQQFLSALLSLRLISRTHNGCILLHEAGVGEVLPAIELQATEQHLGHKELRELKAALGKSQVDLVEFSADGSGGSTPCHDHSPVPSTSASTMSTITGRTAAGASSVVFVPSVSFGLLGANDELNSSRCETPNSITDPETVGVLGVRRRGSPSKSGSRTGALAQMPYANRGNTPLFADERRIVAEERSREILAEECGTGDNVTVNSADPSSQDSNGELMRSSVAQQINHFRVSAGESHRPPPTDGAAQAVAPTAVALGGIFSTLSATSHVVDVAVAGGGATSRGRHTHA